MASIHPTKSGTFELRYRDAEGTNRSESFKDKALARQRKREVEHTKDRGALFDQRVLRLPFGPIVNEWLETLTLDPLTIRGYRSKAKLIIQPTLGGVALGEVDREELEAVKRNLIDEGFSSSTMGQVFTIIRQSLDYAYRKYRVTDRVNPGLRMRIPTDVAEEKNFLNLRQVEELARAIERPEGTPGLRKPGLRGQILELAERGESNKAIAKKLDCSVSTVSYHRNNPEVCRYFPDFGLLIRLVALTGLRAGEMLSLTPESFQFDRGLIVVRYNTNRLTADEAASLGLEGTRFRKGTKNHQVQSVAIPPPLVGPLKELVARTGRGEPIFRGPEGNPLNYGNFVKRHFKPAAALIDVPALRFHDLRHTCAALLIGKGAGPQTVKTRMRHSSIVITLDHYGHLFPEPEAELTLLIGQELEELMSA